MSSKKASNSPELCPGKGQKPSLGTRQGPEINSPACLWVSSRTRNHIPRWLTNQSLILLISCLETPRAGLGPRNSITEPSLASSLVISLPHIPACPGTLHSPTACQGLPVSARSDPNAALTAGYKIFNGNAVKGRQRWSFNLYNASKTPLFWLKTEWWLCPSRPHKPPTHPTTLLQTFVLKGSRFAEVTEVR
jgi:hypothetical protein